MPAHGSPNGSVWYRGLTFAAVNGFSPLSLFANGEQGGWYDPSDLATMFSDAAGTTPAVVDGVVGKILDKSGRGNHRTQATTAQKPILRSSGGLYWLEYDGVDDGTVTAAIDFSGTNKMTAVIGVRKESDAASAALLEFTANMSLNNGSFAIFAPGAAGAEKFTFGSKGNVAAFAATTDAAFNAPVSAVVTGLGDISGDVAKLRVNGVDRTTTATDQGTGNYGNTILYFGRRGGTTLPFSGREYYTVIRGAASTAAQISSTESIAAQKCGVTL